MRQSPKSARCRKKNACGKHDFAGKTYGDSIKKIAKRHARNLELIISVLFNCSHLPKARDSAGIFAPK